MRLRVGLGHRLVFQDATYSAGDEFDVDPANAAQWLATGLVVPASGEWPDGLCEAPTEPPAAPTAPHEPCELPPKPGPRAYVQVCTTHGCPCQTWGGRCPACKKAARSKRAAKERRNGHSDPHWKRFARRYLELSPYCECSECAEQPRIMRPAATQVHHIDGLGPNGPHGYSPENLMRVAARCHSRITAAEQPGGWNDRG